MPDFYPKSRQGRAAWHLNFDNVLTALAAKYGLTPAQIAQVHADALWIQYWVSAADRADALSQQLSKYFNNIAGSDPTLDPPAAIDFALFGEAPAEVAPGVEFRTREIARQIKGHSVYSDADGEELKIVAAESSSENLTEATPQVKVRAMPGFKLEASFKKNGSDAMRFELRRKNGEWEQAAFLMSSPGVITVQPAVAGVAEQVEVRGIFVKKNEDIGNFSDVVVAFVAA